MLIVKDKELPELLGFDFGQLKTRGVGTGEASEARASPEIRAFTIEKF